MAKDLTGLKFGRLTAISRLPALYPRDGFRWLCLCDCGKECVVKARLLPYSRGTKSCGCLVSEANRAKPKSRPSTNLKHGHSSRGRTAEYVCWSSMIQRCTNRNHESFALYGGRGINVCARWLTSFEAFLEDMGRKPSQSHSIDRKNNDGGYAPSNCRWATAKEQINNRRVSVDVVAFGERMLVPDASTALGISERTLYRWAKDSCDVSTKATDFWAKRHKSIAH